MSKKYKEAIDKIVVSDELKSKILKSTAEKISDKELNKKSKIFYLRNTLGYVACITLLITGVTVAKNYMINNKTELDDNLDYVGSTLDNNQNEMTAQGGLLGNSSILELESIEELKNTLGYEFKIPKYLPDEYKLDKISLMFGSLIELTYKSESDEIIYRTERVIGDISGDYNNYDKIEEEKINNSDVTIKSSDNKYYLGIWSDNNSSENSYSINSINGVDKDTMIKIIESIDY